jgi:hypothetical protein
MSQEAVVAYHEMIYRHFPAESEENYENSLPG